MDATGITESELIAALLAAQSSCGGDTSGAITTRELCELTGRSKEWILKRLQALQRSGRLRVVTVHRQILDGREMPMAGYQLAR